MQNNIYNQLIRDKLPSILKAKGSVPHTRVLNDEEYISELEIGLEEYLARYLETGGIDELCDLAEVINAIAQVKGYDKKTFEAKVKERRDKYGAFSKRLYLTSADEAEEDEELANLGQIRDSIDLYAKFESSCDDETCDCHDHKHSKKEHEN